MADNVTSIALDQFKPFVSYDPDTGRMLWIARPLRVDGKPNNRVRVGDDVGWEDRSTGYRKVQLGGVGTYAHRLAFYLATGELSETVDHVNGDRTDNRLVNLRAAKFSENARNMAVRSDNKSGHPGVSWCRKSRLWYAYIALDGRSYSLGRYARIEDAVSARRAAEKRYHGDFAQHVSRGGA